MTTDSSSYGKDDAHGNVEHKVHLTDEKATLLITLYAKAMDHRSKHPILNDEKADEILSMIDYDFEKLKSSGNKNILVVRAKQYDEWLGEFLRSNPHAIVLNLGCGLDTRISTIAPSQDIDWFDVDFPEVIEERNNFFTGSGGYHMIASSLTEPRWLDAVPNNRPAMSSSPTGS